MKNDNTLLDSVTAYVLGKWPLIWLAYCSVAVVPAQSAQKGLEAIL